MSECQPSSAVALLLYSCTLNRGESWAIGPWYSKGNTSDTLHPFLCHSNLLYGPSQQTSLIVRFHFRNGGYEIHEAFVDYFNKSGKRIIPGRDGKSDLEAYHMDNR